MSVQRAIRLACDTTEPIPCGVTFDGGMGPVKGNPRADLVRRAAEAQGWSFVFVPAKQGIGRSYDRCPACTRARTIEVAPLKFSFLARSTHD